MVMQPGVQIEGRTVRKRLAQEQMVISAKCPAVTVRIPPSRVRTNVKRSVDDGFAPP
jgi:hypothetical protein